MIKNIFEEVLSSIILKEVKVLDDKIEKNKAMLKDSDNKQDDEIDSKFKGFLQSIDLIDNQ
jgi:hypothetical protein